MPSGGKNQINIGVKFNVDDASVQSIKKTLQDLQSSNLNIKNFSGTQTELINLKNLAGQLQKALTSAFNVKLNSLNVDKFNKTLQQSKINVQDIYNSFSKAGTAGQRAFNQLATSVLTSNLQLKQTNSLINQMGTTMMNTVKWGIASSVMNTFTNSVQQAFQYVKSLDSALTDIRIVTGDSTQQMAKFADQANRAASQLGRSTMDYSKAALSFYQQGLDDEAVQTRTEAVLKAQNITGAGDQMADYLTAVWNGYKVANEQAELYVDKLAAVADSSASNMSQLAIAMSKVASTANTMGVDVDSLNAQIATIVATTRQAPQSVGNALKTIYTRINDIATGADDAQISLGNYSEKMAEVGINVLDTNGRLRDTQDVIEQVGQKWAGMSKEQQIYLARTMAGQRQINNLTALFDNWGKYIDLVDVSMNSQGATMQKNSRYMESLEAHINQLGAANQRLKTAMIDSNSFKGLIDFGTTGVTLLSNFIQSIGGGGNAILGLGSIATQVFSGVISKEINGIITNFQAASFNAKQLAADIELTKKFGTLQTGFGQETVNELVRAKQFIQQYYSILNEGQINSYNNLIKQKAAIDNELQSYRQLAKIEQAINNRQRQGRSFYSRDGKFEDFEEFQKYINQQHVIKVKSEFDISKPQESIARLKDEVISLKTNLGTNLFESLDTKRLQELANSTDISVEKAKQFRDALLGVYQQIGNLTSEKFKDLAAKIGLSEAQAEKLKEALKSSQQQIKQFSNVKAFVGMVSSLGQISSGINSIINLTKIWENQNLSTSEKALQTFTNLSMAIGMLSSGFMNLKIPIATILSSLISSASAGTVALNLQTVATKGLSVALKDVGVSAGLLWTSILPIVGVIAAITAGGVALHLISEQFNKDATAAKNAAEAARQAKQEYDDVKKSQEDLKKAFDNYTTAQQAIGNMTKGTQQWRDAIKQSNEQILELINKYPQLALQIQNVNGQLILSQETMQKFANKAQQVVNILKANQLNLESMSKEADRQLQATNAGRSISLVSNEAINRDRGGSGEFIQASKEQVLAVAEKFQEAIDSGNFSDLTASNQDLVNWISQEVGTSSTIVGQLLKNSENLINLNSTLQANTAAIKLQNEQIAREALTGQSDYDNLTSLLDQDVATVLGGQQYAKLLQTETTNLEQAFAQIDRFTQASNNSFLQEVLKQINEATGKQYRYDSNEVRGSGENLRLALREEGASEVVEYSKEYVTSLIATKRALQELGNSASQVKEKIRNLDSLGSDVSEVIKKAITGQDLSDYTQSELEQLRGSFNAQDFKDFDATQYDFDSIEQMKDTINSMFDSIDFSKISQSLTGSVKKAFDHIPSLENATYGLQKQIAESLTKAFAQGGKQGLNNLADFYDGIKDFEGFEDLTNQIDFSSLSLEQAKNLFRDNGIEIQASDVAIQTWINSLKQAEQALNELSPQQKYAQLHEIANKFLDGQTDTLTAKEAQSLRQLGIAFEQFFTEQADGTFKLHSTAQQFFNYVNGESIQPFKQTIESLKNELADTSNLQQYMNNGGGVDSLTTTSASGTGYNQDKLLLQTEYLSTLDLEEQKMAEIRQIQQMAIEQKAIDADKLRMISTLVSDNANLWEASKQRLNQANSQLQRYEGLLANAQEQSHRVLDPDIDADGWKELTDYISQYGDQIEGVDQHVTQHRQAAQQLAEAIMRYGHAVDEVIDNYEDWQDALTSGSIQDQIAATEQLQNVYSDLLDLPYQSLSPDFTSSIQNLQLLKQAANGSQEAYNQLMQAARQDIAAQVHLDDSQFQAKFNELYNSINDFNTAFPDLEVGASLDNQGFLDGLSEMVTAAGMTAQQATDYLASMGIDAEVIQNKTEGQEKKTITNFTPQITSSRGYMDWYQVAPDGSVVSTQIPIAVPGVTYRSDPIEVDDVKENVAHSLIVTSAHKSSGGGFKHRQSSHKSPKGSGGGGGGGGRGGGKKATAPKPGTQAKAVHNKIDTKEKQKQYNPYQQVEKSYQRQQKAIKNLQQAEKKITGKQRLKNLNAQIDALEKQNKIIEERQKISDDATSEGTTADLRKDILKDKVLGANKNIFDEDGQLHDQTSMQNAAVDYFNDRVKIYEASYRDVEAQQEKWINNVWNKYNKDQQEKHKIQKDRSDQRVKDAKELYDKQVKQEEEAYKKRIQLMDNYQKKREQDVKYQQQYFDNLRTIFDKYLQGMTLKAKIDLDAGDALRTWNQFDNRVLRQIDKNDILGNSKAKAREIKTYLDSGQIKDALSAAENLRERLANVQNGGYDIAFGMNHQAWEKLSDDQKALYTSEAKEKIRAQLEDLIKNTEDGLLKVQDLLDDLQEDYVDSLKQAGDRMDDLIDQYERVNSLLDHQIKVNQLLYGDQAYKYLNKFYEKQRQNNQKELADLRAQQNYWQQQLNAHQDANGNIINEKAWKEAKSNLDKVTDDMNSKLQQMMQNAAKTFENKMLKAVDDVNNRLTNGLGTKYVDEQWDQIGQFDDYFLDAVNSKFGIQEVTRAYQQAAATVNDPKQQQKINKLMNDQLKILKEKDKLTEYDIERAKASLQVEKARMALEDARNNKTKMRLRRDSQGNYTYQYVADEQKLTDLQAALADAQNNLYNQDKQHYKQNLNQLYNTYKDYIEKMTALQKEYNQTQDVQQKKRIQDRMDLLKQSAEIMMSGLTEDNKVTLGTYLRQSLFDAMDWNLEDYTDEQSLALTRQIVPWGKSEIQDLSDNIVGEGGLLNATRDFLSGLAQASQEYDAEIKSAMDTFTGTQSKDMQQAINNTNKSLDQQNQKAGALITTYQGLTEAAKESVKQVASLVEGMQQLLNSSDGFNLGKVGQSLKDLTNVNLDQMGSSARVSTPTIQQQNAKYNAVTNFNDDKNYTGDNQLYQAWINSNTNDLDKFKVQFELEKQRLRKQAEQKAAEEAERKAKEAEEAAFRQEQQAYKKRMQKEAAEDAARKKAIDKDMAVRAMEEYIQNQVNEERVKNMNNLARLGNVSEDYATKSGKAAGAGGKSSSVANTYNVDAHFPNATTGDEIVAAIMNIPNIAAQKANGTGL